MNVIIYKRMTARTVTATIVQGATIVHVRMDILVMAEKLVVVALLKTLS